MVLEGEDPLRIEASKFLKTRRNFGCDQALFVRLENDLPNRMDYEKTYHDLA